MSVKEFLTPLALPQGLLSLCAAIALGCNNKEKVLDIEGPNGGGVEVERDRDTGAVDVEVNRDKEKVLDIDTPGADVEIKRDKKDGSIDVDAGK